MIEGGIDMKLLKRENWVIWFVLCLLTQGLSNIVLAYLLNCFDKTAWYSRGRYWLLGGLCLFLPLIIMGFVFFVQMTVSVGKKLSVPGEEIYGCPYIWILCIIVPLIGWTLFIVMLLYIIVWPFIMISKGKGEQYIERKTTLPFES